MGQLWLLQVVNIQQQPKHREDIDFMKPVTVPMSNPLDAPRVEARATDTLPAHNVFHQTQAAVRGLTKPKERWMTYSRRLQNFGKQPENDLILILVY